ncbi:MAG: peptidase MA family metallohydrolase [Candidatus Neomarinimicrobiota bacterium]
MKRGAAVALVLGLMGSGVGSADSLEAQGSMVAAGEGTSALGQFTIYLPDGYSPGTVSYLQGATVDVSLALISRFGEVARAPFQLVVVESRGQFQEWVGNELPKWIHAVALEEPARVVVRVPKADNLDPAGHRFELTLLHELTHTYLYRLQPSRSGRGFPGWFHEGLAVYISSGLDRGMHRALIRGRVTGNYYTLDDLVRIYHTSSALSEMAYAQSLMAVQSMAEFYGAGVFRELFDQMRGGLPFPTAFSAVAGEELDQFQARYQGALRRRYNLLLVVTDPAAIFILLPLLLMLAYFVRLRRNRVIRARWLAEGEADSDEGEEGLPTT